MKKILNYINNNKFGESDCQLVAICNAYTHLTGNKVNQESEIYSDLLKKCGCISGSCIDISKALEYFNIDVYKTFKTYELDELLFPNTFFEISVWHKFFGFHSVACVDYNIQCNALRIVNFKHVTSLDGWIFKEDLQPHIVDNPNKEGWCFRTFKLKENGN